MKLKDIHEPLTARELDPGSNSRERLHYIDALKGFACLLVVLGHVAGIYDVKFLSELHDGIYAFHMPLFMTISGFLFEKAYFQRACSKNLRKEHLVLQIENLFGLYIISSCLLAITKIIFSKYVLENITLTDFALILVRPIDYLWYIYVLLELYLTFLIPKIDKLSPNVLLPVLLLVNLFGSNLVPDGGLICIHWLCIHKFFYHLLFFYMGILFCERRECVLFQKRAIEIFGIIALVLSILFWSQEQPVHKIPGANMLVGMGFSLLLFSIFEKNSIISSAPLFQICGKYSLEIYIAHEYFMTVARILTQYLGISNIYLAAGLNFAISFFFSILAAVILKKLHLHALFFKPATFIKRAACHFRQHQ